MLRKSSWDEGLGVEFGEGCGMLKDWRLAARISSESSAL